MKFYVGCVAGGGGGGVVAILKGGTTSFGVLLRQEFEVSAILKEVHKNVSPFKRGRAHSFNPVLRWTQKVKDLQFSHFVAPSSP